MKDFFLRIKNWQLFIIIFLPWLFHKLRNSYILNYKDFGDFDGLILFGITGILCASWQLSITYNFSKRKYALKNFSQLRFKIFANYGFFYILGCTLFFFLENMLSQYISRSIEVIFFILFLNPLSFTFFIIAFFYTIYQNAKLIKTLELKRTVSFSDFAFIFFCFCIFPLGIWLIQSKINRIFESKEEVDNDIINHLID